jgi:hypothetical protein
MSKSVFCITNNRSQADDIVDALKVKGFSNQDVSILLADNKETKDFEYGRKVKVSEEPGSSETENKSTIGGILGWLAGIGVFPIPDVGPFIAAGPIMLALKNLDEEHTYGGITGALISMGIPEYEAKRYEGKIRRGSTLISVHTEDDNEVRRARETFEELDALDIATTEEVTVPFLTQE